MTSQTTASSTITRVQERQGQPQLTSTAAATLKAGVFLAYTGKRSESAATQQIVQQTA